MTCRKADRFRSAFATRCAWPPEINRRAYIRRNQEIVCAPDRCPPKAKVTRSNRVGCARFFLFFSAIYALGLKLQLCLVRVSKQNPKNNRHHADSSATDDVGWKPACLRTAIVSISGRIGARRPPPTPARVGTRRHNVNRLGTLTPRIASPEASNI